VVDENRDYFEISSPVRKGVDNMIDQTFRAPRYRFPFRVCQVIFIGLAIGAWCTVNAVVPDVQGGEDVAKIIKQAEKLTRKGSLPEAEKLLRHVLELDTKNNTAKVDLAYILVKQRHLLEAYNLAFEAAKTDPKNARAFAVLGATLLTAGRFPDAKTMFYNALGLDNSEDLAWAGVGMLDFYENRIDDSIDNLRAAVYHAPTEPDYYFALAQVSARAEKYKEAADAYDQFLMVSDKTDIDRRARIKGLINFLRFLGQKQSLYITAGKEQTSVNFKLVGNRPVIQLRVNNSAEPLNFVLDTGSGISVISDKTAERLRIKPITRGGFAKGIGGDGKFEIVYGFLKQVDIGDIKIRNVPVYIREFHTGTEGVDGYIGLSLIAKFLTTIDYGKLTFALVKKDVADVPADGEVVSLPLRLTSSGFLSGEVNIEGVDNSLNFIVDTGASVSVISDELAGLSGVSHFERGEKMRVIGSAGITDDVPSFLLPRVSFGKHSSRGITAIALDLDMINEASGFQQAGILGGNFLRNYKLTFDFKNSKVTFVPIIPEK
jgi:thioredoxin-like negative regulator of GroEL/predicted aspartyl protease